MFDRCGSHAQLTSVPFLVGNPRYYVEDHKQGAFALGAPRNDVLEVTGHPAEDFETTARRYAVRAEAQRKRPSKGRCGTIALLRWPRGLMLTVGFLASRVPVDVAEESGN